MKWTRYHIELALFCKVNLSGVNLSWADLYGANLFGADLSGANLFGADLYGANLSGVNLSWADLSETNLNKTKLPAFQIVPERRGWSSSLLTRFECRNGHEQSLKDCKGCAVADQRWRDWLSHEIEMEGATNATKYS